MPKISDLYSHFGDESTKVRLVKSIDGSQDISNVLADIDDEMSSLMKLKNQKFSIVATEDDRKLEELKRKEVEHQEFQQ